MPDPDKLTPEEEQKRLEIIQKQGVAAKDLASTYEKIEKSLGKITDDEKESLDVAKQLVSQSANLEKNIQNRLDKSIPTKNLEKSLKQLIKDQTQALANQGKIREKLDSDKAKALTLALQLHQKERSLQSTLKEELKAQDEILDKINRYKSQSGPLAKAGLDAAREELSLNKQAIKDIGIEVEKTIKRKNEQKDLVKQINATKQAHEKLIEQQGEEIALTKQNLKTRDKFAMLNALNEKFNVKQISDMFTVAGIFKILLDSALRFNEISVKTSKSLGYGADNADRVTSNLVDMTQKSTNLNVTLKNAGEAMSQLNEVTGGVAEYSADALTTQIMLTKQLGLSGEEAAGIYKFSVLTGKSSEKVNDEMVAAFVNTRNAVKGSADFKTTMAAASKVSGQLSANLQNNPGLITKAVVQAQAFGTSLEQINTQGASLLNWESSLNSELDAELLTGKQLNLEKARAAALTGDQITLAEELNKNVGTLSEYQSMNVLQQNALAAAIGLTSDQLADQLRKQKIATEQGKSLAQITKEEALEAENRQAIQDKFNAAILKLQDIIGNLAAGPLSMFLDGLSTALKIVGYIIKPIEWLADLAGIIGNKFGEWADALGPFSFILKGIAGVAILLAAYGAYAALAWIPVVGPILGAAAAVSVMAKGFGELNAQQVGDMISPATGKTQVSTKEGGLFELSKNDDLIAGPGLASKKGGESIQGPSIDLTPMISAINAVEASINRLYSKDSSVHMDGKKVGTTLAQGSHKVA